MYISFPLPLFESDVQILRFALSVFFSVDYGRLGSPIYGPFVIIT